MPVPRLPAGPSPFVQRAIDSLDLYDRLRAGGMSHSAAVHASGLYQAIVQPEHTRIAFDPKLAQAGKDSA